MTLRNPSGEDTVAVRVRPHLGTWIMETVLKESFMRSLPRTSEELEAYTNVIKSAEDFQHNMRNRWQLTTNADATRLTDYTADIRTVFVERKTERLLEEARRLAKQSLFEMERIEDDAPADTKATDDEVGQTVSNYLQVNLLSWPRCHVARSVTQLITLLKAALGEEDFPQVCARRAVRHALELWPDWATTFHAETLEQVPQAAALLHNSLMFLAHCCIDIAEAMRQGGKATGFAGCADLIPGLRRAATQILLAQLRRQRTLLLETLAGAGELRARPGQEARRALRAALHQLTHLGGVWHVLSKQLWTRTIGVLVSTLVACLANWTLAREDISTEDGVALLELLNTARDGCVALFYQEAPQGYRLVEDGEQGS